MFKTKLHKSLYLQHLLQPNIYLEYIQERYNIQMSDEEERSSEQEQEDQDQDQDQEQNQDQDQDQKQDQDQDQDQEEDQDEKQNQQQESKEESDQKQQLQVLPKFAPIEAPQLKFHSLLAQISNLNNSVEHLINSFPSHGGMANRYYQNNYRQKEKEREKYVPELIKLQQKPRYLSPVIMKDQDVQVSMQPQIIIQPSKKPQEKVQYPISNQSNRFLAQLYQENQRLKRWTNSNSTQFYPSKEKFQRKDFEKGVFDIEERNNEIDKAIEMLKRE